MTAGTALITGASSGIGLELAKLFARDGYDLVLVARRRERLEALGDELARRHGISYRAIGADLADPTTPAEIERQLRAASVAVDVLVNNAGFGELGPFAKTDLETERRMIEVNVTALTALTRLFLPGDARTPPRADTQRRLHGGVPTRSADVGLLRDQGVRHFPV